MAYKKTNQRKATLRAHMIDVNVVPKDLISSSDMILWYPTERAKNWEYAFMCLRSNQWVMCNEGTCFMIPFKEVEFTLEGLFHLRGKGRYEFYKGKSKTPFATF